MRKILYFFIFLILINSVCAEKITIFNFHYDNGIITLKQQFVKEGYYPDRNIQKQGYSCKLTNNQNNELYSFNFDLPNKLFIDTTQNNEIKGNMIILNKTDFSFIMPYLPEANNLICYNPAGYEIIKQNIEKITLSPKNRNIWYWIYFIIAFIGLIIIIKYKKRNINKQ